MSKKLLTPLEELARKNKLPTVLELLNKSLETTGITYLANELHFHYTNLHAVLKGDRKLPLNPTIYLARIHGYEDNDGVFIYVFQELCSDQKTQKPPKPRGVPAKTPAK
jgi:hypothetical protein